MQLYMHLYTCAETKNINSLGQQVIPGESSFPLSFPAGVAVLDLGKRDPTLPVPRASSVSEASEWMEMWSRSCQQHHLEGRSGWCWL